MVNGGNEMQCMENFSNVLYVSVCACVYTSFTPSLAPDSAAVVRKWTKKWRTTRRSNLFSEAKPRAFHKRGLFLVLPTR